jgi:hypothetical protein
MHPSTLVKPDVCSTIFNYRLPCRVQVPPSQRKSWPERHGEGLTEVQSGCAPHGVLEYNGAARGQSLRGVCL